VQFEPQLIWSGLLGLEVAVTVPLPVNNFVLVTVRGKVFRVKTAATVLEEFRVTVQLEPEIVSHPVHLVKLDPTAGVADSVTTVPLS